VGLKNKIKMYLIYKDQEIKTRENKNSQFKRQYIFSCRAYCLKVFYLLIHKSVLSIHFFETTLPKDNRLTL
jgi:hypothetical protein